MQRYTAAARRLPRTLLGAAQAFSGQSEAAAPSTATVSDEGGVVIRATSPTELRCPRVYHSLTEKSVKEQYERILQCVETKSCPPNAWLWSLIGGCSNEADIKLLFQTLQNLRRFRLSSLRLNENFNDFLCESVADACARAGAYDYGLMTLWKHNIYGLTPSIASAHYLLRHAKGKNDYVLMEKIMKVLIINELPSQPGTADLVVRICYNTGKWDLLSTYLKRFLKDGIKLRDTTFDIWMKFAADRGDASSIWDVEKQRSKYFKEQSISSAFSCAKGFLLERKPESAAVVIHGLKQDFWHRKKHIIEKELQNLVDDWLLKVVKNLKGDKKALTKSLGNAISSMMDTMVKMDIDITVNMEQLGNGNLSN